MSDKRTLNEQHCDELTQLRRTVSDMEHINRQLRQETAEQKAIINKLQRKEAFWKALLENLPIDFWARDLDQRVIIESKVKAQIWGDMQNKTLDEITVLDEETIEHWRQNNRRVLAGETITEEMEMTTPAGDWKFLRKIVTPIYVEEEIQGIMGVNIDLTARKKAEDALLHSEERLRMVVENMPVMVNAVDDDLKFVVWNQKCEQVTGYKAEEIIGNPKAWDLLYPDKAYLDSMLATAGRQYPAHSYNNWEWVLTTKAGEKKTILWSAVAKPFPVADWASWGIGLDVTEQRQAQKALRESEEQFRSLYLMVRLMCDNVPDMIWAKDLENRFIFANRATCEKLLNTKDTDEPVGKSHQYFADREKADHPHDPTWHTFDKIGANSDEIVLRTRRSQRFDEHGKADGQFLFMDVYKAPFWNEKGEMIGTVGCGRIVTREKEVEAERKQTEAELQEIRKRYELATTAGQVWVWEWRLDTEYPYNDSGLMDILGYSSQEYQKLDEFWRYIIHPDDLNYVTDAIEDHFHNLVGQFEFECRLLPKDGDYRWFLVRGSTIQNGQTSWNRIIGTATDITKQKQARQQLRASLQEKEVLLREIHHRVKNNLQLISSLFELQIGYLSDNTVIKILEECQTRIQAMALVHQALYRSENLNKISVPDYTYNLIDQLQAAYISYANKVNLTLEIDECYFQIDTALYCGLIINELVSNALKHAFPNNLFGQIHVKLNTDEANAVLTVSDNGIGFSADIPFGQGESLGLLLVDTFVKQLEGTIKLNSSNGTTIQITFPKPVYMEKVS